MDQEHLPRLSLLILSLLSIGGTFAPTYAEIPQVINYQGKLTDMGGSPVVDGTYSMTFGIFDVETGGIALWSEVHDSVQVTEGMFSVLLGESTALGLDFAEDYWLEIHIESDPQTPRQRLGSVGYSFMASGLVAGTEVVGSVTSGALSAIMAINTASMDYTYGVWGESYSTVGAGVYGQASASSGENYGVYGQSNSSSGHGVYGWASSTAGLNYGVYGRTSSPSGYAGHFDGNTSVNGDLVVLSGDVAFGTSNPDPSAILDISSQSKGVLLPRLTTLQRDAIVNPAAGLLVFNVDSLCFDYYTGIEWFELAGIPANSPPDTCYAEDGYEDNDDFESAYVFPSITDDDDDAFTVTPTICPFDDDDWFALHISDEFGYAIDPTVTIATPPGQTYTVTATYFCDGGGVGVSESQTFNDFVVITLDATQCEGGDDSGTLYLQIVPVYADTDEVYELTIHG